MPGTGLHLPDILKPLARLFDEPKPNVLMVVGTGISIGATHDPRASWKGLLLDAVDRIESLGVTKREVIVANRTLIEDAFTGEFKLSEILQRAESIVERLGGVDDERFASWLKDSVGALKSKPDRRQSLDAIANLARAGALILTTNYDSLLSEASGFAPVTWEEPEKILEVVTRKRKGIIHIHGHWSRPSSVILGRSSYDRIKSAVLSQTELKSLWLLWHWVYLGCGSGGLDDPNLGALLQWADDAELGESSERDYFLSTPTTINVLPDRIGKSANLVKYAYDDHATDLPVLLQELAPEARASPFQPIGPDARRMRRPDESPLSSPFPSWQEYLDGAVPGLSADEEVIRRLDEHGWACVLDVASVGKSTLAYRIAARPEYRNTPAYSLLLSQLTVDEIDSDISPQAGLARLARPGVLFVIDDSHQRPELAHTLWQQWRERPAGSKLLILATRTEKAINLPGDSSLRDFEAHTINPAVVLQPTPEDLEAIANYIMARLKVAHRPVLKPPQEILKAWHKSYGREIGAFVVAISQQRGELVGGDFRLPASAGAAWMKERHLGRLEPPDIENTICLAVFGEQEFEIEVPEHCLPHPLQVDRLLKSGLVERNSSGRLVRYSLREPGWGRLILAAFELSPDWLEAVTKAAVKSIGLALSVSSRLKRPGDCALFWQALATNVDAIIAHMPNAALSEYTQFLKAAEKNDQPLIRDRLWHVLNEQVENLAQRVFATPLQLAELLNLAARQQQQTFAQRIWDALAVRSEEFVEWPLQTLDFFLTFAAQQKQENLVRRLWRALAAHSPSVLERVFETPVNWLGVFLDLSRKNGQHDLNGKIWRALAAQPDRLAETAFAFASPLNDISSFMNVVERHGQKDLAERLWQTFALQSDRLAEIVFTSTLNNFSTFVNTAEKHGQKIITTKLWSSLEVQSDRLVQIALASTLNDLSAFVNTAKEQGQKTITTRLWASLEVQSDRLAQTVFASTLNDFSTLVNTAEQHGQNDLVQILWHILATQPAKLSEMIFASNLNEIAAFLNTGERQKQNLFVQELWRILAERPDALVDLSLVSPLNDVAAFVNTAKRQQQNDLMEKFWQVLATKLDRLAARAANERPNPLMSFLVHAPSDFKTALFLRFEINQWVYGPYRSQRFSSGAPGLAGQFGSNGREESESRVD